MQRVRKIKSIFEGKNLPLYLLAEMMGYLPGGQKNLFWRDLSNLLGWDGALTRERELSRLALPNQRLRVGKVQIRVIGGLERNSDHIVFEVFPANHLPSKRPPRVAEELAEAYENLEDIGELPF